MFVSTFSLKSAKTPKSKLHKVNHKNMITS